MIIMRIKFSFKGVNIHNWWLTAATFPAISVKNGSLQPKIKLKFSSLTHTIVSFQGPMCWRSNRTVLIFTGCTNKHACTHPSTFKHTHTHTRTTCWSRDGESPSWLKLNSGEQLNQRPAFDHLVMWTWQVTIWLIKCKWQSGLKTLLMCEKRKGEENEAEMPLMTITEKHPLQGRIFPCPELHQGGFYVVKMSVFAS